MRTIADPFIMGQRWVSLPTDQSQMMGVESGSSVSRDIRGGGMGKFHHLYENIRLRYDTTTVKNWE